MLCSRVVFLILSVFLEKVCGHYGYLQTRCQVQGSAEKVEFIFSVIFNKIEHIRYNSTQGKTVGCTEAGVKVVEDYKNKTFLQVQAEFGYFNCKKVLNIMESNTILSQMTAKPEVIIQSVTEAIGNQKAVLVCSAYDFYPKHIKMTWIRDDKEMTTDMISFEEMANGDWYYQVHSYLEYFPQSGEKICCVVEHISSHRPMIYYWDPSLPESERSKIVVGAVGLLMGIFTAVGGLIFYNKKQTGFYRLPVCLLPLQTINNS